MKEVTRLFSLETPLGSAQAGYEMGRLCALEFVEVEVGLGEEPPAIHKELCRQVNAYFNQELKTFDIPLAAEGTKFQKKVWELLGSIPFGETRSYHELAIAYGDVKAIRAIAAANGANPIMLLTPCHRVIGSDGSLTGYAGGLWRKEALLDMEQGVQRLF